MKHHNEQKKLKSIFYILLVLSLGILWYSGYDAGFGSDELDMNAYGKANIAYYKSGTKDTSFLQPDLKDGTIMAGTLKFYGSAFDYIAIFVNRVLGNSDGYEINVRHAICQIFAIMALFFTGLIVHRISGTYLSSIISLFLLMLTPLFTGLSVFDTKDIPFTAGYIATIYYIIRFAELDINTKNWRIMFGLILSLTFTLSIRIGGLILIAYLLFYSALCLFRKNDKVNNRIFVHWFLRIVMVCTISMVIVILLWPYVLSNPLEHLKIAIQAAQTFPQRIPINFEGDRIDSLSVPLYYLPKWMLINIPILILITFVLTLLYKLVNYKGQTLFFFILITLFFPIVFSIINQVPLYNGWRHMFFVYPSIVIISTLGITQFISNLSKKAYQYTAYAAVFVFSIQPIWWSIKHAPYQHIYFNELAGNFENNYFRYETDYWQISVKEALDWTIKNRKLNQRKDSVVIATNAYSMAYYYLHKRYPKIKIKLVECAFKARNFMDWDYAIFNNLFVDPFRLENCFVDTTHTIYSVDIESMPITKVYFDSLRYDYKAFLALNKFDFYMADSLYSKYLNTQSIDTHKNNSSGKLIDIVSILAFTKLGNNDNQNALKYALIELGNNPGSYYGNLVAGAVYLTQNNGQQALFFLNKAISIEPNDIWARSLLSRIQN